MKIMKHDSSSSSSVRIIVVFVGIFLGMIAAVITNKLLFSSSNIEIKPSHKEERTSPPIPESTTTPEPTSTTSTTPPSSLSSSFSESKSTTRAIIYHAFDLNPTSSTISRDDISKFLWRALFSAASLRIEDSSQLPQIFLLTNYHPSLIEKAKQIWTEKMTKISSSSSKQCSTSQNNADSLAKLLYSKKTFSIANLLIPCGRRSNNNNDWWPFDKILFPKQESDEEDIFSFKMKADGLYDLQNRFEGFPQTIKSVLYLDSDTLILNTSLTSQITRELFDTIETSQIDVAMVQEYNWHRDLSPFLYEPVLRSEIPSLNISSSLPWWTPHYPAERTKPSKKNPSSFGTKNHALYELQYNTGLVMIKNIKNEKTNEFFNFWRTLHQDMPRCRDDKVLWDQCSLPHAIRHFHSRYWSQEQQEDDGNDDTSFRIATLNDRFNFREALGSGCSNDLYYFYGQKNKISQTLMQDEPTIAQRMRDERMPNFDQVVLFHTYEVKNRQDEWIEELLMLV